MAHLPGIIWFGDQSPGNSYQLLLTAGKLGRKQVFFSYYLETVKHIRYHRFSFRCFYILVYQWRFNIFIHCQLINQVISLENKTDILFI